MSLHTWHHQRPRKPSSYATFILNPHWVRAATGRTSLRSMRAGLLRSCPALCDSVVCGLSGFSVRERASSGKNTGVYWPILVSMPF